MQLKYDILANSLNIQLSGDYIGYDDESKKAELLQVLETRHIKSINVDGKSLGKWDSSLVVILFELQKIANKNSFPLNLNDSPAGLQRLLSLAFAVEVAPAREVDTDNSMLNKIGSWAVSVYAGVEKGLTFMWEVLKSVGRFFSGRAIMRKIDFLFAFGDCSYKAIMIVSLISFMVGLILAFVGSIQLQSFGAEIYVASLVTIGMTRIMGAVMTGIIMAGRTGASYAATIGTMQVNEEIDALKTMGIGATDFLVLPRILALVVTMPILTMWADFMGMLGGGFVGVFILDIPLNQYWDLSVDAIKLNHFMVGIIHGFVFGIVIALCGCYYGIYCGRNAESVGVATTKSVVTSIVWMIVMTGFITVLCQEFQV